MTNNLTKNPTVEVVIINYRRPDNIRPILTRFREQSYPCTITLVDHGRNLDQDTYKLAHRVYTFNENYGPYSRFIPIGNYFHDFTYFHDDDMLPGIKLVNHFVTHALQCPGGALFGQNGRNNVDGYNKATVLGVPDAFTPVSMLVRGYFIRTKYLCALLKFKRYFKEMNTEDDTMLALALKTYTNKLIYLTPEPTDPSEKMNQKELPAPFAACARPGHYVIRDRFWRQCEAISLKIRKRRKRLRPS